VQFNEGVCKKIELAEKELGGHVKKLTKCVAHRHGGWHWAKNLGGLALQAPHTRHPCIYLDKHNRPISG